MGVCIIYEFALFCQHLLLTVLRNPSTINYMEQKRLPLEGKTVLVTGSARRVGKVIALAAADAGADLILHHAHSLREVTMTANEIKNRGCDTRIVQADFSSLKEIDLFCQNVIAKEKIDALINSAAIFKPVDMGSTTLDDWNAHLQINLTTPFMLSQSLFTNFSGKVPGRIINIVDWRALKPGKDHFPYTISKAALASMTKTMAVSMAPKILVNGIALGAILPPENQEQDSEILSKVPMQRWADLNELKKIITYLLIDANYITGEIIHLDGGRHLL